MTSLCSNMHAAKHCPDLVIGGELVKYALTSFGEARTLITQDCAIRTNASKCPWTFIERLKVFDI